jgi:hypothetical protein
MRMLADYPSECLRELGLEDEAMQLAYKDPNFKSFRWCDSVTGEEYGRIRCWGSAHENMVRKQVIRLVLISSSLELAY